MTRLRIFMPKRFFGCILVFASLLSLAGAGCHKNEAPEALPADQVPKVVEDAFKNASPEAKGSAAEVVNSLQKKDAVSAFTDLQVLSSRNDLTPEQRQAAARSMISVNERLRAAAADGDQRAQEALQQYHAHK